MKKYLYLVLPLSLMLLVACGSHKDEQRVEQGMEEEAPIVTESEKDALLDFEETEEEYQEAKAADAKAAPTMQSVRDDRSLDATLDEAKSDLPEEE